jgi:NAD(P)-dependent dehydrogenase (short-subunit alcohol dehydrogenase family)
MTLSGKTIMVTGAFGAAGRVLTSVLAAKGAHVAAVDATPAPASLPGCSMYGGVDLSSDDGAASVVQRIVAEAGGLDGLVNLAGGFTWQRIEGGTLDAWDGMYRTNLRTAVSCCKAALPHLLKSKAGRIVNVGALGAGKAAAGMGAYAASKAGVAKLTEALAEELKDRGVTVNAVLPSTLDTPRNRSDMPDADFSRWVSPAALAEVISFLLSDAAGAVTAALIPVPGRV